MRSATKGVVLAFAMETMEDSFPMDMGPSLWMMLMIRIWMPRRFRLGFLSIRILKDGLSFGQHHQYIFCDSFDEQTFLHG